MKIVFFGSGVIGGCVAGWITPHNADTYVLDQGEVAQALRARGITLYHVDDRNLLSTVNPQVIDSLEQVPDADLVVLGVKNYSIEFAAEQIKKTMGDRPIIMAMQNGIYNQQVLPKYFSKVVYCVISFNAWADEPGLIGYQKKGPLILGTPDNSLRPEMERIAEIFNRGVETVVTDHFNDAAHCKLVINLTNSLTTLIGHKQQPLSDPALFQKLLTGMMWEGVEIVRSAGIKECKLGGMPPWRTMWVGAKLPRIITKGIFEKNVKKMVLSSMAQDVLQHRRGQSELETINGEILTIAQRIGHPAPYNRAIYELCKTEFGKPEFVPLDVRQVWQEVQKRL
ncbi:MAG: 2-dehydropantoate 2-reductase [Candidatus Alcyoniella australis]|nr:2-dehydropantoate 2-reductase [Candidatus Alcyoniella australis]